jgi:hypothetical protein
MGGILSGRNGWRQTVEGTAALRLDINSLAAAVQQGPWQATITWWEGKAPVARARITLLLEASHGLAQIDFRAAHPERRRAEKVQNVAVEASPCRFGGKRWWWVCPATGKRSCLLMLPKGGDRFLSRAGWRLAYASQAETALGRCHRRLRKLRQRMGGDTNALPTSPPPPRPKWMRQDTYARLTDALELEQSHMEELCLIILPRSLLGSNQWLPD